MALESDANYRCIIKVSPALTNKRVTIMASKITNAQYEAIVNQCNFRNENQVRSLVTSSHTNVKFNDLILEKHMSCDGAASYFSGFFGTEQWADGQGLDEVREYHTPSYIPLSNEYFAKKMKPCMGAADLDACDWDTFKVPEGGRGTLPGFQFYEWGLETERTCIANIRHIRNFWEWSGQIINDRERADQQIMNMFYTMMAWKTAGHKVVLEYEDVPGTNGAQKRPKSSADIRNPFRGFSYNYLEEYFPSVSNPENIGPLSIGVLQNLARTWEHSCNDNHVATGSRGERIWEMWNAEDWYMNEGLRDPDFIEKIRRTMPAKEFAGYSLNNGQREVIENWAMKTMQWLPRLAESTEGGLIPLDTHEGVDIEVGKEHLISPQWENAPFAMAMITSPEQGSIITRPDLTMSGDGIPILPITGSGEWIFRNDYDRECNKRLNKPYSEKHYEMGFRTDNPDAGMAIIHRLRKFHTHSENFCDLNPVIQVAPNKVREDSIGIGCRGGRSINQASLTEVSFGKLVHCTSQSCGDTEMYRIQIDRLANKPGFNSIECECGSDVLVEIGNDLGEIIRSETAVLVDNSQGYPEGIYFVRLAAALADGECIKSVQCQDATPTSAIVVDCSDVSAGQVRYTVDSPIEMEVGDNVTIEHFDEDGNSLAQYGGAVESADIDALQYEISSNETGFDCAGPDSVADPDTIASTTITKV